MGNVTLNFSESEFKLFSHYCSSYCRLHDETRKNSIQILLELYKHQTINIQEHNLDNVFAFFYNKCQEFEMEYRVSDSNANLMMRVRICYDIISFLEDLEKIYTILRKKGTEVNYLLLLGTFSKIINQMWLDNLNETAADAINAIIVPLHETIDRKLGPESDIQAILNELVIFVGTFNRLSPDLTFNDTIIPLIATSLIKRFGKKANNEEICIIFKDLRYQSEMNELESALEGGFSAQAYLGSGIPVGITIGTLAYSP